MVELEFYFRSFDFEVFLYFDLVYCFIRYVKFVIF